jgi:hypothetical protein
MCRAANRFHFKIPEYSISDADSGFVVFLQQRCQAGMKRFKHRLTGAASLIMLHSSFERQCVCRINENPLLKRRRK